MRLYMSDFELILEGWLYYVRDVCDFDCVVELFNLKKSFFT